MKYLICGILGIAIGFFVFYLLFRIANKDKLSRKLQDGSKKKLPKPNFTKLVLVAVLFTYFVGLYIGIKVTLIDYSQFGVLATYIATPTTTVIALYCWKAKAENIIKIKKGYPEETKYGVMGKTITAGFISDTINGIGINSSIKCNNDNLNNNTSRSVSYVVMHYTGNSKDTAKANANYFSGAGRNASAHFFVDDAEIYQSVELRDTAWHCGAKSYKHGSCRNANSVGIEMCCTAGNYRISDRTKENAAYLCAFLCKMLGIGASGVDSYVLRHYDVTGKNCPAQMVSNPTEWQAFKNKVKGILGGSASTGGQHTAQPTTDNVASYRVKITADVLNVRVGPGTDYGVATQVKQGEVYTIVGEVRNGSTTWGRLKSGAGYISLGYTQRA